jgi:hypothetical protein
MSQHVHYVGPGFKTKMDELGDSPASCERYPFLVKEGAIGQLIKDDLAGEMSLAVGKMGLIYIYTPETGVIVVPNLDMLLAGGLP